MEGTVSLLSVDQVAEALGCGKTRVFYYLQSGELPSLKLGKLRRVRPEDLSKFIATKLAETQAVEA